MAIAFVLRAIAFLYSNKSKTAMSTYFTLVRKISPYTHADILLGVFSKLELAESVKEKYYQKYLKNPLLYPWHKQAYKSDGLLYEDLIVESYNLDLRIEENTISVVSIYYDFMGQIFRKIDSFYADSKAAKQRLKNIKLECDFDEPTYDLTPQHSNMQVIQLNKLQSDKRTDQPNYYQR